MAFENLFDDDKAALYANGLLREELALQQVGMDNLM